MAEQNLDSDLEREDPYAAMGGGVPDQRAATDDYRWDVAAARRSGEALNDTKKRSEKEPPFKTNDQWRNYHHTDPLANLPRPLTDEERVLSTAEAARVAQGILPGIEHEPQPVLRDPNGNVVLGSKGMTVTDINNYLVTHPGSSIS